MPGQHQNATGARELQAIWKMDKVPTKDLWVVRWSVLTLPIVTAANTFSLKPRDLERHRLSFKLTAKTNIQIYIRWIKSVSQDTQGIKEKLKAITRPTYDDGKSHVLHRGKISEGFEVQKGVYQGCILPSIPVLIINRDVMENVMNVAFAGDMEGVNGLRYHLKYIDNIWLSIRKVINLRQMVLDLKKTANRIGLKATQKKSPQLNWSSVSSYTH